MAADAVTLAHRLSHWVCERSRRLANRARIALLLLLAAMLHPATACAAQADPLAVIAAQYAGEIDMRLSVPAQEQRAYAERLRAALSAAGLHDLASQFFLVVDRNPVVQAAFVYWLPAAGDARLIGASPVSTGHAGGYEYFINAVLDPGQLRADARR